MTRRFLALALSVLLLAASAADAQTARTSRLMREKLLHAQRILAALTTSDYMLLQNETRALRKIIDSPQWTELMTTEFRPYATSFTKALADLETAAGRRDYDAAGASYGTLTAACITCHKHVMQARIAEVK